MRLAEFSEKTGATHKQIMHWAKFLPITKEPIGPSDRKREYREDLIPRIRTLVAISKAFGGWFSLDTLTIVFYNYNDGFYVFDGGVVLEWRIDV